MIKMINGIIVKLQKSYNQKSRTVFSTSNSLTSDWLRRVCDIILTVTGENQSSEITVPVSITVTGIH